MLRVGGLIQTLFLILVHKDQLTSGYHHWFCLVLSLFVLVVCLYVALHPMCVNNLAACTMYLYLIYALPVPHHTPNHHKPPLIFLCLCIIYNIHKIFNVYLNIFKSRHVFKYPLAITYFPETIRIVYTAEKYLTRFEIFLSLIPLLNQLAPSVGSNLKNYTNN
jgi:hypothetical protein